MAFATKSATLKVDGGVVEGGNTITLEAGKIYKLNYKSSGKQTSTTKNNIGTIFN